MMKRYLLTMCFGVLVLATALAQEKKAVPPPPKPADEGPVSESVLSVIRQNYTEENIPLATDGDLRERLESVDEDSTYMNPEQYEDYKAHSTGAIGGVGAAISKRSGYASVISVISGGPADKAGVQSSDAFVAIDGKSTREMSLAEIRYMLAGVPGSMVTVSLLRADHSTPERAILSRELISIPPVRGNMVGHGIGQIHVEEFARGMVQEVAAKIKSLQAEGAKKLILDLRNCAEGEVSEGVATANLFLDHGSIVYLQGQKFPRMSFNADASKTITNLPLVVLVNKGTAGPAEIVASAILENARGDVVGDKTFGGDGSVQKLIEFPDNSAVIITVAKYYSPAGKAIYFAVTPNIVIADDDGPVHDKDQGEKRSQTKQDAQLEKAIAVLQSPHASPATDKAIIEAHNDLAQQKKTVPPPPKPADEGPSLEATMKFIQEKMNDHGPVFTLISRNNVNPRSEKYYSLLSDVVADVSTCALHVKQKVTWPDVPAENVVISTSPFKDVDSIAVESAQDMDNRHAAENGHPEVSVSYTPAEYLLSLNGTKKDAFSFHDVTASDKEAPRSIDYTGQQNTFYFRDDETANRIAKAMQRAVELCGGGSKDPF